MCGIVGFLNATKNPADYKAERGLFETMLYADAVRGFDSTGIFWTRAKETSIFKKAMQAADFIDLKPVDKILADIDKYDFIIGHNRWATSGKITAANAHPFQIGDITLVHNGTLRNWKKLPGADKIDVDSEAICNSFNEIGAKATLEQLEGAYALVWHDASDNTINLARNDERPLSFAYVRKHDTNDKLDVVIASEYLMASWLAGRQGYEVKEILSLRKGCIVTFKANDLEHYTVEDFNIYSAPVVHGNKVNTNASTSTSVVPFRKEEDNQYLRKYNLKFEQRVRLFMDEFESYQENGAYGFLCNWVPLGKSVDDIVEFRINGLQREKAMEMMNKYVEAKIVGAWKRVEEDYVTISLAINSVTVLGDEDLGFRVIDDKKVLPPNAKFKIFNDKEVDKITWERKTRHGCAWCGAVPQEKDAPDLVWETDEIFTCLDCASDREQSWASKLN